MPAGSAPGGRPTATANTQSTCFKLDTSCLPKAFQIRLVDRRFREIFGLAYSNWK